MRMLLVFFLTLLSTQLFADPSDFNTGPQIKKFGEHAAVTHGLKSLSSAKKFNVVFDVGERGKTDTVNRKFNGVARFINMHVANGVAADNINLALVVHGKAAFDLLKSGTGHQQAQAKNPNALLLKSLAENNVQIFLCGQTAEFLSIKHDQLLPNVQVALSAMTTHALLQQQGYTLNPF